MAANGIFMSRRKFWQRLGDGSVKQVILPKTAGLAGVTYSGRDELLKTMARKRGEL